MLKPLLFALVASILGYQLLTIGLADNGDFPRIAGRLSLCPQLGWDAARFRAFVPEYVAKAACFWDSGVPTAAMPVARVARALDRGPVFHIRVLGILYGLMLLVIFGWLLRASALYAAAALVFLDAAYIAYCNSFFLEAASLVGLLAAVAGALRKNVWVFLLGALVLVTSKTQHAWLALPLAAYAVHAFRPRAYMMGAALALVASAVWMTRALPLDYKALGLWDSVFVDLLPHDAGALTELGVGAEYAVYSGRNAYQFPDQATADHWTREFYARVGYGGLARYYAAHAGAAAQRVWRSGSQLYKTRPLYLAMYERGSAHSPAWLGWSEGKSAVYRHAPWLAGLVYAASAMLLWRSPYRAILAMLLAMAPMEFALSCFADFTEDYRHHFLLHALCDVWLCFAAGHLIAAIKGNFRLRGRVGPPQP